MDKFDPYHQWLGISPAEQPPDLYRLLGVMQFENDPTVIENAADRQMSHLKTFQTGPRSADSQRLLNEMAAARVCLLSADKKNEYDQQLRQTALDAGSGQQEYSSQADHEQAFAAIEVEDRIPRRKSPIKRHLTTALVLLVATVVILVLLGISVPSNKVSTHLPGQPNPTSAVDSVFTPHSETKPAVVEPKAVPIVDPTTDTSLQTSPDADSVGIFPKDPVAMPPNGSQEHLDSVTSENVATANTSTRLGYNFGSKPKPKRKPKSKSKPRPVPVQSKTNQPVPSASDLKKIAKVMEGAYDFAKATTPVARTQLAQQLMQAAVVSVDSGEAFVLLNRSAELAAEGSDPELLFRTVDEIGRRYKGDPSVLCLKLLKQHVVSINSPSRLNVFAAVCKRRIDDDLAAGRYEPALDTAKMIYQSTQKLRNKGFRKQVLSVQQALAKLHKEHQACLQAEKRLAETPSDGPANLLAGRWYCFKKNDYRKGLPLLAKGSDAALSAVAKKEVELLSQNQTPADQVAVGDAWWKLAEKAKGVDAVRFRVRSMHWYDQAKPRLTGLAKDTVDKRLELFEHLVDDENSTDSLDCLMRQTVSVAKKRRHPIKWQAIAVCDDEYDIYVNGKRLPGGRSRSNNDKLEFKMSRGDIITVCCKNHGGARGFCCVLRSEKQQLLVSGAAWMSYKPTDKSQWYDPKQIAQTAPPLPGNAGLAAKLCKQTGVAVQEIWGHGETCYLTFQVP